MRHDASLYYRWLKAESRCRALSHEIYSTLEAGAKPLPMMLTEFADAIAAAAEVSTLYLAHVTELSKLPNSQ